MSLLDKATLITTPTAHSNGTLHSIKGGAVADFDVVRGSAATRVNAEGLIESVATNIPRIDYTTGEGVALLEPQSTNLMTYSEDFSNAAWTKVESTVTSGFTSPDGASNSYKLAASINNTNHRVRSTAIPISAANTTFVFSVYIKPQEITKIAIVNNTTNLSYGVVNLTTNSVIEEAQGTTSVTELSGGFVRVLFETQTSSSGFASTNVLPAIYVLDDGYTSGNPTAYSFAGNGTDGVLVYGAQLEELPYATSYIPTSGAIATRLADVITVDLTSFSLTSITETIDGVEQTPITVIPSTYTIPQGRINKITMI